MKPAERFIKNWPLPHWSRYAVAGIFAIALAGCGGGGGGGDSSAPVVTTPPTVTVPTGTKIVVNDSTSAAQFAALTPAVPEVKVSINSAPVVAFSVTDGNGNPIVGLGSKSKSATAIYASYPNIAFSLAKLVPASGSAPSKWVNYIVTTVPSYKSATAANKDDPSNINASVPTRPSTDNTGTLVDNGNGTYTYTFFRDITKVKEVVAAAAETATNKNADLGDLTYDPNAVHRLTIQISGNAPGTGTNTATGVQTTAGVPMTKPADVIYDFIPATGKAATASDPSRDVTSTAKCNECHTVLGGIAGDTTSDSGAGFHGGSRNKTEYCVVCHTDQRKYGRDEALTDATGNYILTKDAAGKITSKGTYRINDIAAGNFPNMIHKTHFGKLLSKTGYDYAGVEFNEVGYPQDVRNCTKCHDGSATSTAKTKDGDNWIKSPSRVACGGCHDAVNFATGKVTKAGVTTNHFPGPQANDGSCVTCHTAANNEIYHLAVTPPNPANSLLPGGTNTNTNSAWIASNTSRLPVGAIKVSYDVQSVSRNAAKNPVMVFKLLQNGVAVPLNDKTTKTEIWDNFMGAPSVYFVYAMPQDGIAAPADFNASASVYLRSLWNGKAAGTLTGPDGSGYYTATLTGVAIPDNAVMLTGGLGYSYNVLTSLPLTQTNLVDYPVAASTAAGLTAGMPNKTGGLVVIAPNVNKVATGYSARRPIVDDAKCNNCHQELGTFTEDAFHAGQRNDGTSCSWCHTPNRASSGWSADSASFVHSIHAGAKLTTKYNWHAVSATEGFWDVKYPGILKECTTCHLPGTYDYSAATSASAFGKRQYRTVMTGTSTAATFSTSPYVAQTAGTVYGVGYSTTGSTVTEAAGTSLVISPIATTCFACHDDAKTVKPKIGESAVAHMKRQGASIYEPRSTALGKVELCATACHLSTDPNGLSIKDMHAIK